jgi:hypothetical protein
VNFRVFENRIRPKSHIGELRGLLPEKYSPLRAHGDGLQGVYPAEVGRPFAAALFRLIGGEANKVADVAKAVDRAEQLSPSREPVSDMRTGSKSTFARTPRSPTSNTCGQHTFKVTKCDLKEPHASHRLALRKGKKGAAKRGVDSEPDFCPLALDFRVGFRVDDCHGWSVCRGSHRNKMSISQPGF